MSYHFVRPSLADCMVWWKTDSVISVSRSLLFAQKPLPSHGKKWCNLNCQATWSIDTSNEVASWHIEAERSSWSQARFRRAHAFCESCKGVEYGWARLTQGLKSEAQSVAGIWPITIGQRRCHKMQTFLSGWLSGLPGNQTSNMACLCTLFRTWLKKKNFAALSLLDSQRNTADLAFRLQILASWSSYSTCDKHILSINSISGSQWSHKVFKARWA